LAGGADAEAAALALAPPLQFPEVEDLGRGREDDVAWWDPRVGKENRETAGTNCVLGMMKIFLLHPYSFI
jgi:hypothetical protein